MGTICILLGLIIFFGSLFLGFAAANVLSGVIATLASSMVSLPAGSMEVYIVSVGVCGFIGLLICLNLVMHGLTYNKVCKLARRR